jgi:hypothetical protein
MKTQVTFSSKMAGDSHQTTWHYVPAERTLELQFKPTHPICYTSILILSFHLHIGFPRGLLPLGFPTKTLKAFLSFPIQATDLQGSQCKGWFLWPTPYTYIHSHTGYMPCPSHTCFDHHILKMYLEYTLMWIKCAGGEGMSWQEVNTSHSQSFQTSPSSHIFEKRRVPHLSHVHWTFLEI